MLLFSFSSSNWLSVVTWCLTSMVVKCFCTCACLLCFEVEPLTSTPFICSPHPWTPLPLLFPSSPVWLSNQIHLSPSAGQSHHIQTRGRGEEGDRCWRDHLRDISLRADVLHGQWRGVVVSGLLWQTWAGYYSWVQDCMGLQEQACVVLTLLSL